MRSITRRAEGTDAFSNKKSDSPVATLTGNGVATSIRAKKTTNRSRPVALFRPFQGAHFVQSIIDSGE